LRGDGRPLFRRQAQGKSGSVQLSEQLNWLAGQWRTGRTWYEASRENVQAIEMVGGARVDAKEKKSARGAAGSDSAERAAANSCAIIATGGFGCAVWDVVTPRQQS